MPSALPSPPPASAAAQTGAGSCPRPTTPRWSTAQPRCQDQAASVRCFGLKRKEEKGKRGISTNKQNPISFLALQIICTLAETAPHIPPTTARGVIYRRPCRTINQALFWLLINLLLEITCCVREKGREERRERERKQDNAAYPQGSRNSFWQSDTNWIVKPQRASNEI